MSNKTLMGERPAKIFVCTNNRGPGMDSCVGRGSKFLLHQLDALARDRDNPPEVEPITCLGLCKKGPNMRVAGKKIFTGVTTEMLHEILYEACGPQTAQIGEPGPAPVLPPVLPKN